MRVVVLSLLCANLVLLLSFVIGRFLVFKKGRRYIVASYYSVYLAFLLIAYCGSILVFIFASFFFDLSLFGLILSIFIFAPFLIGRFATFRKIGLWTNIQILALLLSLMVGLFAYSHVA